MRRAVVACLLLGAIAGSARRADADGATAIVARPLVPAPGELDTSLALWLNLAPREAGTPIALAPDVVIGLPHRLAVALVHDTARSSPYRPDQGLCLSSAAHGCKELYRNVGVEGRWQVVRARLVPTGVVDAMLHVGGYLLDHEPARPALLIGAAGRWRRGRVALTFDPTLQLGLANQDRGNRAQLHLPLTLQVQPTCRWVVALRVGADAELATGVGGARGPVGLAITAAATSRLELTLEGGFPSASGPQNQVKSRAASIAVAYRFR